MLPVSVIARPGSGFHPRLLHRNALTLAALLGAIGLSGPAYAQVQRSFGEWAAVCQGDTAGYCSANTRVRARGATAPGQTYAYRLQVWRGEAGQPLEVTFMTAGRKPGDGQSLEAQVDRGPTLTFVPVTGYRSIRGGNAYALQDPAVLAELVSRMERGSRLDLRYLDADGEAASVSFSLNGFKQALRFFHREPPPEQALRSPPPEQVPQSPPSEQVLRSPPSEQAPRSPPSEQVLRSPPPEQVPRSPPPEQVLQLPPPELPPPAPARSTTERARRPAVVTETAPPQHGSSRSSSRRGPSLRQFACRGNEPSWSLMLDRERGTLSVTDEQPQVFSGKFSLSGEGRTPIMIWKASGQARKLTAIVIEQACSDSMSDSEGETSFAFVAQVTLPDGRKVRGCCNAGLPAAAAAPNPAAPAPSGLDSARIADFGTKATEDWARLLPELQPAIDACLARTPGGAPYITKAWPMNKSMVGARTRGGDGTWYECIATASGAAVERIEMLPRGDPPLQGENFVLFTPAKGTPRAGTCWQHERVLDASGTLRGYLSYNMC